MWRQRRSWVVVGVVFYVLILLVSPLLHHDLDCHLKAPSHCDACKANPLVSRAEPRFSLTSVCLPCAGQAEGRRLAVPESLPPPSLSGRSPPA